MLSIHSMQGTITRTKQVGDLDRSTCKIAVLGNQLVFGVVGISGRSNPRKSAWDAFSIAKKENSRLATHPTNHLIQKLAEAYMASGMQKKSIET
jgi:hypothetical protein